MSYDKIFRRSIEDREGFWKEQAEAVNWFKAPEEILSKDEKGHYRWYKGGKLNTCYLALDHHVENGRADQLALIYDSPVTGKKQTFTYRQLLDEVALFAGVLKSQGVEKGDRVILYMPMIPEAVIAMLACARLGAVHSVVFGGFAANELAIRIDDAQPKLILTASVGIEIKKIIPYMPMVNAALNAAEHAPEKVIVYQRPGYEADLKEGRDFDWQELLKEAKPETYVELDALDPLYILYTSGTTGTPKGILRDNGGHAVALKYSMDALYDARPGDVYWAASDVGWVVGHSYIVYGPLLQGCTTILFEGKPIKTPDAGTFWRVIQDYKVNVMFTAPTAIRAIKKADPDGHFHEKYDTSSLRYLFLAGEHCDVPTYDWSKDLLQVPVIDHWWQTESGWPMLTNPVGVERLPVKPGSAYKPVFGYDLQVLNEDGQRVGPNEEGIIVVKMPLPPGCLPSLWHDDERFQSSYLDPFPGFFFSGDGGFVDEDGYVFITGRIDDIINVAGHRLTTTKMEEVLAYHEAVAECAVVGIDDEMKGQVPMGLVVLKEGANISQEALQAELVKMIRNEVGPIASFKKAVIVKRLPKTRSGKILRKIIRAIADGKPYNPPSTIEDMSVLPEIEEKMEKEAVGKAFSK
jgi:acyl-coenzyme A synthetase/AMP-(fatty) acid ligase